MTVTVSGTSQNQEQVTCHQSKTFNVDIIFSSVQKKNRFFRCSQTLLPWGCPGQRHGSPHSARQSQHPPSHRGHQHSTKPRPSETPGSSQSLAVQTPTPSLCQQGQRPLQSSDWPQPQNSSCWRAPQPSDGSPYGNEQPWHWVPTFYACLPCLPTATRKEAHVHRRCWEDRQQEPNGRQWQQRAKPIWHARFDRHPKVHLWWDAQLIVYPHLDCVLHISSSRWSWQMGIQTLRWMWSLSRTHPSSGTSQKSPESKVRRDQATVHQGKCIQKSEKMAACNHLSSSIYPFLSSSNLIFPLLSPPSFSHQSVEGQRARGLHHKGQPFFPWSLWPCHEGGLPAADRPAEQKRWKFAKSDINVTSTLTNVWNAVVQSNKLKIIVLVGDLTNELVRHFLIETSSRGVRLKGCPNEPYFGECLYCWAVRAVMARWGYIVFWVVGCLSALVYQHSMTPLALPCKLMIPTKGQAPPRPSWTTETHNLIKAFRKILLPAHSSDADPNEEALELATPTDPVVELLKQGAGEWEVNCGKMVSSNRLCWYFSKSLWRLKVEIGSKAGLLCRRSFEHLKKEEQETVFLSADTLSSLLLQFRRFRKRLMVNIGLHCSAPAFDWMQECQISYYVFK